MRSAIQRYFWVVNLLLLGAIAFLGAQVISNLMAEKIVSLSTPAAKTAPKKTKTAPGKPPAKDWAEIVVDRNLFNSDPPEPEEEESDAGVESEETPFDPTKVPERHEECAKSDAPVRLTATMVAEPAEWSLAAVQENGKDRMVRVGVILGDHELVAIQRGRLVLAEGTKFECIEEGAPKKSGPSRYSGSAA